MDLLAPGPVEDLHARIENETNIYVSWSRPSKPNGPIDGYAVDVFECNDGNLTFFKKTNRTSLAFKSEKTFYR